MIHSKAEPQELADADLDAVQGAGTAVGNPGEKKVLDAIQGAGFDARAARALDDGQPLVEIGRRKS